MKLHEITMYIEKVPITIDYMKIFTMHIEWVLMGRTQKVKLQGH
jgi:hypothetical protein